MTRSKAPKFTQIGLVVAAAVTALVTAGTLAAAAPSPAVKTAIATRQANFKKMGAAMKTLNEQLKADAPNKAAMAGAAKALLAAARAQPKLFPAGSGPSSGVKTEALANIWTDRATFDGQMTKLLGEANKLVGATSGGNADAIRAQYKATGASCSSCHRQFRADT
ncbi:c-type cytochrome [Novosphingobium album (ex Liu et al. 2023)]|uniref:Cytochrome c n=1 Tax=Novosphingobium album (ex Liu et al. 2023) TaxID=3031130 RepID=A0ABT5WR67_9SPHN|nr:cytochrome c [Novosphingobium album (ex Liu et al. 2023)]MDE8652538.1 cytochrome c [Novosphingobium album (ex Liu et al. 2023)]